MLYCQADNCLNGGFDRCTKCSRIFCIKHLRAHLEFEKALLELERRKLKNKMEEQKTEIKGLGTSTRPNYSALHLNSMARIAAIYSEGEEKYKDNCVQNNWSKVINNKEWQQERANHAFQHLKMYMEGDRSMDHLAKIGWFCDVMMEVERQEIKILSDLDQLLKDKKEK